MLQEFNGSPSLGKTGANSLIKGFYVIFYYFKFQYVIISIKIW
jgi:hypothetical protein